VSDKLSIVKKFIERIKQTFLQDSTKDDDKITIKELIEFLERGGFGVVMLLFSLPILIPLPPPVPTFISLPLLFFSVQMILGLNHPKLPNFLSKLSIKRKILAKIVEKSVPYINKIDKVMRPRFSFFIGPSIEKILGIFCFIFSISILLPIPLTNLIPGIGIIIISLGLISKDGLFVFAGLAVGIFGTIITMITIVSGIEIFGAILRFFS
jgi:hypothetical protein